MVMDEAQPMNRGHGKSDSPSFGDEKEHKTSQADRFYTVEEIRNRLSISTIAFWRYRPVGPNVLQELVDLGKGKIELGETRERFATADAGSTKLWGEICRSYGIEVIAYHANETFFFDIESEAQRIERVDLCRRQIDTLLDMGGALWGSHAQTVNRMVFKCYEDLVRHVEGTAAVIMLENHPLQGQMVKDRMTFLERMDHPQVGLTLDIGHVRNSEGLNQMTVPGGPTEVLQMCGSRLRHVHLHGFIERDHYPPLVEGDRIQWVELFRMFRAVGYSGAFNFEPFGPPRRYDALEAVAAVSERIVRLEAES